MDTSTKTLPESAIKLITALLDEQTLARKNADGNYFFPLSRASRMRELNNAFGIIYPQGLPEPYLSAYYEQESKQTKKRL